jgi:PKD repeat protein
MITKKTYLTAILFCCFFNSFLFSQNCGNRGFESGNFSGWTLEIGENYGYPADNWVTGSLFDQQHHVVSNGVDQFSSAANPLPVRSPNGGNYSALLGTNGAHHGAERLIYSFTVQASDSDFIYEYAVVFEDPNHPNESQPYFDFQILDQNGTLINCGFQHYIAGQLEGFYQSPIQSNVYYKPWTTVGIDLTAYIGQQVTIVATTADCAEGGHFGYAYLDFICTPITSTPCIFCSNQPIATLNVPNAGTDVLYTWSTGETNSSITINPQLYNGQTITCMVESPISGGGCGFKYYFPIEVIEGSANFSHNSQCLTVNFTDESAIESGTIQNWHWDFGDGNTSTLMNPTHTYAISGNYNVTLTITSSICGDIAISHFVTVTGLILTQAHTDILCNGTANGNAIITASGTPPYSYNWTPIPPMGQGSNSASGLSAGAWNISVIDAAGCVQVDSVLISEPNALSTTITSNFNVTCYGENNGAATVNITGGTGTYSFLWTNSIPQQTTQTVNNLTVGTWFVQVFDNNNCQIIDSVIITEPQQLLVNINTLANISCFGGNNGSISTSVSGGTPVYTYDWFPDGYIGDGSQTYSGLPVNSYNVTVTDAHNCIQTASINITQPSDISISAVVEDESCSGFLDGSINLTVSGGTPTYSYNWSGPSGFTSSNEDITNLTSGVYTVTATDVNGCAEAIDFTIYGNVLPTPNAGTDNTICGNTYTLNATASGGTGTWTASPSTNVSFSNVNSPNSSVSVPNFSNNTTYTFTWTEINGICSASDHVSIQFIEIPIANAGFTNIDVCGPTYTMNAIPSVGTGTWTASPSTAAFVSVISNNSNVTVSAYGTYNFTWTEVNHTCSDNQTIVVNFYQIPTPNAGVDNSVCGTTFTLNATTSVGTGTWICSNSTATTIESPNQASSLTTANIYGTYAFTYTENNHNCMESDLVYITYYQIPTSSFTASVIPCFANNSTVTYTGNASSAAIYTWNWSNGNALPGSGQGSHQVSWNTANANTITLQVTENGCPSTVSTQTVINPELLTSTASSTNIICNGDTNGSVTAAYIGGTFPYSVLWNDGATTPYATGLTGGNYQVTITDAWGCSSISSVAINEPTELEISPMQNQNICNGRSAALNVTVLNGTPPYTYLWDNGVTTATQQVTPLVNTTYTVTVTDANGCITAPASVTIQVAERVDLIAVAEKDSVCPGENVRINMQIIGGVYPYMVSNSNTLTTSQNYDIVNINQDVNILYTVVDACGSTDTQMVEIGVYPTPEPNLISNVTSGCEPLAIQFTDLQSHGSHYYWDFGDSQIGVSGIGSISYSYTHAGLYDVSLTVTSAKGCKTTKVYNDMIHVYPNPEARFLADRYETTYLDGNINFTNTSTFNNKNTWTFGDGESTNTISPSHFFSTIGYYWVMLNVETNYGCTDSALQRIRITDKFVFYAPNIFTPGHDGLNDYFYPFTSGIDTEKGFVFTVYDRWGMVIYKSEEVPFQSSISGKEFQVPGSESEQFGWNGRFMNTGEYVKTDVYHWIIRLLDTEGVPHEYKGRVNVIR